jgi:hypothetical protein
MGMERVVSFSGPPPTWSETKSRLSGTRRTVEMRMIDNMPAYPDEEPPDDWKELRVTLGAGIVTVRREPGRVRVIVWGNADEALKADQEALARAFAEAGGGVL